MHLQVRRLDLDVAVDTEAAYDALFAHLPTSAWLDSSRREPGLSTVSVLAAGAGPLAEVLRYRAGTGHVEVSRHGRVVAEPGTVVDALRRRTRGLRVDAATDLPVDLAGGWVGAVGYELAADFGLATAGRSPYPDAVWLGVDRLVVVDHAAGRTHLLALTDGSDLDAADRWLADAHRTLPREAETAAAAATTVSDVPLRLLARDRERYLADVAAVHRALRDGESYEVCLTNTLRLPGVVDDRALHTELRRRNPAPYGALLRLGGLSLVSSSPERFLRVTRDGVAESKPIKGTVPRRGDPVQDGEAAAELEADPKARAENLMIVDLLRNDLSRVCEPGTVEVPVLMGVESYATVHHLVSTVRGRLAAGEDALSCLAALFPGGSMTGAPKPRTMEIIAALEEAPRGLYSGAFGYVGLPVGAGGAPVDLAMTIRSAVVTRDAVTIGGGGAVVADSDPHAEWHEMLHKVSAVFQAVAAVTPAARPATAARR
ncbi:MAG: anthranilate synthase component I family protein [Actinomycetes bacterium]